MCDFYLKKKLYCVNMVLKKFSYLKKETKMPDLNDFYAFKNTSGDDNGPGCGGNLFIWLLVIIGIIWLIGKFS